MPFIDHRDRSPDPEEREHNHAMHASHDHVNLRDGESDSDSDSDPDDDSDEFETPLPIKKRLDNLVEDLMKGSPDNIISAGLDLTQKADIQQFLKKDQEYIYQSTENKTQNLLHLIAGQNALRSVKKMKSLEPFVTELLKDHSHLLSAKDDEGHTPLHRAILARNRKLVRLMCDSHRNINDFLGIQTTHKANCLHLAIEGKGSSHDDKVLRMLIERSDNNTLTALNRDNLTPLHMAVAHNLCDDGQLPIVQQLLDKCGKDLNLSSGPVSLYRHHLSTCKEAEAKAAAKKRLENAVATPQKPNGSEARGKPSTKLHGRDDKKNGLPADKGQESLEGTRDLFNQKPSQPSVVSKPPGKFSTTPKPDRGTAKLNSGATGTQVPVGGNSKNKPTPMKAENPKIRPTKSSVSAIGQCLKEHYLRTCNHDDAIRLLYGSQHDKQINFDLTSLDSNFKELSEKAIKHGLQRQEFENVLQYVAIPHLRVIPEKRTEAADSDGSGRTDLKILFKWLKEDKKVEKIFRVIVDDLEGLPHQDEAIEACLTGVEGVEFWDWKKIDLSPDVIQKAARNAKIVHLYWSGQNIALRAWSEDRGLRQLIHLEKIHLYYRQGLETQHRLQQNLSHFKQTMENCTRKDVMGNDIRRKIQVTWSTLESNDRNKSPNRASIPKNEYEPEKWIKTMESFAQFLQTAENADPNKTLQEPIKVAIIDDGVVPFDPKINIGGGRSFCVRDPSENLHYSYYDSSEGHGTAMAMCVSEICPKAELYVLRLDEYPRSDGTSFFTAESAVKAVKEAIDWKVDIISMSWTIEKTPENKQQVDNLDTAISDAARKNILMFCAATDGGAQTDQSYPARADTKQIFKIGGAKPSGNPHDELGDTNVDFILPGTYQESHGELSSPLTHRPRTGSSVATARAAGLAAVILHCGRASASRAGTIAYKDLRNHERMKQILQRIGITKGKYIQVWAGFDQPVKDSKGEDREEWTAHVDGLVRWLTRE